MNWMKNNKKFTVGLGVVLVFAGIGVFLVSNFEINGLEAMLANESLSVEEVWRFEGALQWWRKTYFTVTLPVTVFLTLSGIASILSQQLFSRFAQKGVLNKFEETLKQACQINPD